MLLNYNPISPNTIQGSTCSAIYNETYLLKYHKERDYKLLHYICQLVADDLTSNIFPPLCIHLSIMTQWGRDKMVAIL